MICYMHEGNPYGHLKVGDKVILPPNLARMVGETLEVVEGWLEELRHAGVYDIAEDGSIYSRRMIRDENLRQIRANGGKLGGNPKLKSRDKVNLEDNQKVVQEVKQKPTPSSSSSSSSSSSKNIYTSAFEEFWSIYPSKTGKGEAYKNWKRVNPDKQLTETILASVDAYKDSKRVKDGFVKNPATWLNQRCWEDEAEASVAQSAFAGDV
jgi:CubicO group peptidase (beta-lactamase class C family)